MKVFSAAKYGSVKVFILAQPSPPGGWFIITPPEVANTSPGVNRGSGGGARGCGFEERVGVHARMGGFISYSYFVCVSVLKWQFRSAGYIRWIITFQKKVFKLLPSGESRNQLRGLKEGGRAMRGAMLCLSADLTTHAVYNFTPCTRRSNARAHRHNGSAENRDHRHNGSAHRCGGSNATRAGSSGGTGASSRRGQ